MERSGRRGGYCLHAGQAGVGRRAAQCSPPHPARTTPAARAVHRGAPDRRQRGSRRRGRRRAARRGPGARRARGCRSCWPDVATAPAEDNEISEIEGAWAHADDPGVPDWRELLEGAIERVELFDYSLIDILAADGVTDTLAAKAGSGCRVRILISAPDSIWVRARAHALAQDEDYIGRSRLALEIETARGYLEPLTQVDGIALREIYADPGHRILRFDEQMLVSPNLHGTPVAKHQYFTYTANRTKGSLTSSPPTSTRSHGTLARRSSPRPRSIPTRAHTPTATSRSPTTPTTGTSTRSTSGTPNTPVAPPDRSSKSVPSCGDPTPSNPAPQSDAAPGDRRQPNAAA
jgi:hypothetical protein